MIAAPTRSGARALLIIFAVALVVRTATALTLNNPGYFDAFAYQHAAENMLRGRGMVDDFVWSYADTSAVARSLPHPSHLYWMPMTSWLAWLGMAAFGASFFAAQLPFVVLGALVPPLAAALSYRLFASRAFAVQAALFALFAPSYFDRWGVPEPLAPFAIAASAMLLLAAAGRSASGWTAIAAGVCAAMAHLTRADGVLLVPVGVYLVARARPLLSAATRALGFLAAYAGAMLPWWQRQISIAGTPLPGGGGKTLFFLEYDDMFAFERTIDVRHLLQGGIGQLLRGRAEALIANVVELASIFQIVLVPMAIAGACVLAPEKRRALRGIAAYALLLFVVMTLVTPHPAQFGSLYRSGAALVPWVAALAPAGAAAAAARYARFRGHDEAAARRAFGGLLAAAFVVLAGVYHAREVGALASDAEPWNARLEYYRAIGAWLDERGERGPILTTNPPAFTLATGRASAMTPTDGVQATLHASAHFHSRYLLLESNLKWAFPIWSARGEIPGYRHVRDWPDSLGQPARLYERLP